MRFLYFLLILVITACSSSRSFKKDYVVTDASHKDIPSWLDSPNDWAQKNDKDYKKFNYYFFETEPKNSRTIACELANARASSRIAAQSSQFIKQALASSITGDPQDKSLYQYVEEDLVKIVQANIVGVKVHREYWERRNYKKELGAPKDRTQFVCAVLAKISKENMKRLYEASFSKIEEKADNSDLKARVQEAKEKALDLQAN